MGLWLKCPACQENNPLYLHVCRQCGKSLDNLPPKQRVYVVGPEPPPAPEPSAPSFPEEGGTPAGSPPPASEGVSPPAPAGEEEDKSKKKPKRTRKKKD